MFVRDEIMELEWKYLCTCANRHPIHAFPAVHSSCQCITLDTSVLKFNPLFVCSLLLSSCHVQLTSSLFTTITHSQSFPCLLGSLIPSIFNIATTHAPSHTPLICRHVFSSMKLHKMDIRYSSHASDSKLISSIINAIYPTSYCLVTKRLHTH